VRFVFFVAWFVGSQALGQGVQFYDGFESTLLTTEVPRGRWTTLDIQRDAGLSRSPLAALDGDGGLRLVDDVSSPGRYDMSALYGAIDGGPSVSLRFWFRVSNSVGPGDAVIGQLFTGALARTTSDVRLVSTGVTVGLSMTVEDDRGLRQFGVTPIPEGRWVLAETMVQGVGGRDASIAFFVDGEDAGALNPVALVDRRLDTLGLGETFANDGRWTGLLDFDEVAVADQPLPSTVALEAIAPSAPCQRVDLSLRTSTGARVSWLKPVDVTLHIDAELFSRTKHARDRRRTTRPSAQGLMSSFNQACASTVLSQGSMRRPQDSSEPL
jgi:hypothetical protein